MDAGRSYIMEGTLRKVDRKGPSAAEPCQCQCSIVLNGPLPQEPTQLALPPCRAPLPLPRATAS